MAVAAENCLGSYNICIAHNVTYQTMFYDCRREVRPKFIDL